MGRVTLVPHANPVGLAQAVFDTTLGRFDLNGRMNFNRAFPTGTPSDLIGRPMAQRLKATLLGLATEAEVVLDLHCDDEAPVYLYAHESRLPQARDLAQALGAAVILTDPSQAAESFDMAVMLRWGEAAAGSRFAATVELRGMLDVRDDLAASDAAGLYQYLVRLGTVRDDLPPVASPEPLVADVDLAELIPTPVAGAVLYEVEVGDWVTAGQRVAQVLPEAGTARHEVLAPADGYVMTRKDHRFLRRETTCSRSCGIRGGPADAGRKGVGLGRYRVGSHSKGLSQNLLIWLRQMRAQPRITRLRGCRRASRIGP